MRFVMVNADEARAQCEGNCLRCFKSDHECARQARTLSGGDGLDLSSFETGLRKSGACDRHEISKMLASREFGHYATVLGMHLDL